MEGLVDNVEIVHLGVPNFDAGLIGPRVEFGVHEEPVGCTHAANQLNDRFMIDRIASPWPVVNPET